MVMSGRTARRRRILDLYSSTVCGRFIMVRMRSEPLCTGRCRKLTTSGVSRDLDDVVGELDGWLVV
jgi:hypothetical protein